VLGGAGGKAPGTLEHLVEHAGGKQADIVAEHAEDEPVDKMCNNLCVMALGSQPAGKFGKFCRGPLG
jgi:hypothetical protein